MEAILKLFIDTEPSDPSIFTDMIIKEDFFKEEVVSIACEVNKNLKAIEELLELCADAALDCVSVVAVVVETGEVAAVLFNKIQVQSTDASEKPFFAIFAEERCSQTSSRSLVEFMVDVDGRCNFFEKYNVDCSFELMFFGTKSTHRRRGLAKLLIQSSINIARKYKDLNMTQLCVNDLGPKYAHLMPHKPYGTYPKICQAIMTAEGTRRIAKALKFTVHLTLPLSKFVFNGKTYTERIGEESSFCEVVALALN
ncbi:unnamed protein product [Danaus chrysippus]|uniref:(African queen) hypothetical protein n=1 Tax=Danaus chrysippus TaxID=151541 RepID=A0A8J2QEI4_9NEOP|nr:unnamed protein product [Danaus chrysippus]